MSSLIQGLEQATLAVSLLLLGFITIGLGLFAYFADIRQVECEGHLEKETDLETCEKLKTTLTWFQFSLVIVGALTMLVGIGYVYFIAVAPSWLK